MVKLLHSADARISDGAVLWTINDQTIDDFLEYQFYNDITKTRTIVIESKGVKREVIFKPHEKILVRVEEPVYRRCENDCYFCFINGLPQGLRKELYFRDDDYRLSFLFGNFLSLTNITQDDIKRIGRLKISPLYVSVHTTDAQLRKELFKNDRAGLIMSQLSSLIDNDIKIHCQIVVIPGITDAVHLMEAINDLSTLYPGVCSIGVVPVGKTKYLKGIPMVSKRIAQRTIELVNGLRTEFRKKHGRGLVYCADEFFINAKLPIPQTQYYDDFPQYENGIGIVRTFIDEITSIRRTRRVNGKFLILTGRLALPFVNLLKMKLEDVCSRSHSAIDVIGVGNDFFGNSVNVSGLVGADDFALTISKLTKEYDRIILPPNCTNDSGKFIDDKTINDDRTIVSPRSIKELVQCLQS